MTVPAVTAWSYSRFSDYKRCPLYFKLKHLTKEIKDEGSAATSRGTEIHTLAENFVKAGIVPIAGKVSVKAQEPVVPPELAKFSEQFLQLRHMNTVVEQNWGFKNDWSHTGRPGWFGDDVWLRVKVDVAVLYDDDTAEVIDHKTGKMYDTNEDQVELFAAATFKRFPQLTHVTTRLWYLDSGDEVVREYDVNRVPQIVAAWNKRIKPMFVDRKFAPTPNQRCRWCPASRANGGPCKF